MNKNSGYILATKTLRTNRIVRIINHKTHIKRTNNTLYKRLYECKRRERTVSDQRERCRESCTGDVKSTFQSAGGCGDETGDLKTGKGTWI